MGKRDRNKGHARPKLIVAKWSVHKWEMCPTCEEVRERGKEWKRPCPGPSPEKRYMGG